MKNRKKISFREFLLKYTIQLNFPVYLLFFYIPGYVLSAMLIPNAYGIHVSIALLVVELLELKALYCLKGTLFQAFLPLIALHPCLCAIVEIANRVHLKLGSKTLISLTGTALMRLRAVYVGVAFVCIMVRIVVKALNPK